MELTYEEYKELEAAGEIDEETEYHIADAAQTIQNLQDILDGLQSQINTLKGSIPKINNTLTSTSTTEGLSAAQGKKLKELIDDTYYKPGDTINQTTAIDCSGCVTSATKSILVTMTVSKSLANIKTVACTALTAEARGLLGYINSTSGFFNFKGTEGYTITCEKVSNYSILVRINKTEVYTNVNNNTPVTLRIRDAVFTLN